MRHGLRGTGVILLWALLACGSPVLAQYGAAKGEWHTWGGDHGFTRYSALTQIDAGNASALQPVWRWRALPLGQRPDRNFKATPLMVDGRLYVPTGQHQVVALDPATGEELWRYTPEPADIAGRGLGLGSRSLAWWSDGKQQRLFHNTLDGRLLAIDARTGLAVTDFGDGGTVLLKENLLPADDPREIRSVGSSSPAAVVGNVVVAQVVSQITADNKEAVPGFIRGYDVRTGALLWTFHTIPQPGEYGHESWENDSWRYTGNTGVWSMMSVDTESGYIYLPVEAPSNDFYGGHRLGDNLYSQSIVCLDARTGERVWHFQLTHHGTWDYDPPAAPILHDVLINGERIKAVTQLTKQGMSFVFNRLTGEPIWPIEELPVPQGDVPGERLSPTQPFPSKPEPYTSQGFHEEDLIDFTPELRQQALAIAENYVRGPLYTPVIRAGTNGKIGTWVNPGYQGGSNWNGAAFDPETAMMFVPVRNAPMVASLSDPDPALTNWAFLRDNSRFIQGPQGLPIMRPPWSSITATDMNAGEHRWSRGIGPASDFIQNHPALQGLGLDFSTMGHPLIRPSPLVTKTLLFLAEAGHLSGDPGGPMFRAYDKLTGTVVAEIELPEKASAAPMTYLHEGRQYIVIGVSSADFPAELVALALPDCILEGYDCISTQQELTGIRQDASSLAQVAGEPRLLLSEPQIAAGWQIYAEACAVCHGQTGEGVEGGAPALKNSFDVQQIERMVSNGGVEMPAMSLRMSAEAIQAVSQLIAAGLPPLQ
ncbi:MAG: PQQ-binding-like beta-propeller repeat protein [Pseudomonadales bacterium]|nr:PQQ-binding-like beta-propeller repeat protein [Pseudomonadales bacterium]